MASMGAARSALARLLLLPVAAVLGTAAIGAAAGAEQCPPGFKTHSPGFWCATQPHKSTMLTPPPLLLVHRVYTSPPYPAAHPLFQLPKTQALLAFKKMVLGEFSNGTNIIENKLNHIEFSANWIYFLLEHQIPSRARPPSPLRPPPHLPPRPSFPPPICSIVSAN